MEEWKVIPNTDNRYKVSNRGRVFSIWPETAPEKEIIPYVRDDGYIQLHLYRKQYFLHRLVAQSFCDNPNNYKYVTHISDEKLDNRAQNLRWVDNFTGKRRYKKVRSVIDE
jgi:hypothetical protein